MRLSRANPVRIVRFAALLLVGAAHAGGVPCPGDLTADGHTDGADLAVLLGAWGTPSGDLTADGTTDGADLAVLLGAWGDCPTSPCGQASHGCCSTSADPGCQDETCCANVCVVDPHCCEAQWDIACVADAQELCVACGASDFDNDGVADAIDNCLTLANPNQADADGDGIGNACEEFPMCGTIPGDCCVATLYQGCNDAECCEAVCALDHICCEQNWDDACASEAAMMCGACGTPDLDLDGILDDVDNCKTVENPNQADADGDGIGDVCDPFPFCGAGSNDCCYAASTPGCNDAACCEQICAFDPFCCYTKWDLVCADEADEECAVCNPPDSDFDGVPDPIDNCPFVPNPNQHDSNRDGVGDACEVYAECGTSTNDCCTPSRLPGCSDAACCAEMCDYNPYCCDVAWDWSCSFDAQYVCSGGCP
ncbi:MAG: thrombospondin type 3 repeat-containing protein [Phycisphaerae bacterium]|jgi:hypothetical protein|nr:thrombospondin type 3 repeat-containing protein [Phycisphaerae bacterium]